MSKKTHSQDLSYDDKLLKAIEESGGFEWPPGTPWPPKLPDDLDYSLDDCIEAYKKPPCNDWNDYAGG